MRDPFVRIIIFRRAHPQKNAFYLALTLALCLFASMAVCGQAFMTSLSGVVTDATGGVVPGISIELKNAATGDVRETLTASDGTYHFSQLPPGAYELTAKAPGFKTFVQHNITLLAQGGRELNITMELGEIAQSVEVTETAVLLDTKSANVSATLNPTLLRELPLFVGNPLALVLTQASANVGIFGEPRATVDQNYAAFGLNGSRSMASLILLDGAPAQAGDWGGLMVAPTVEGVQEMQIIQNTYDAQFGRSAGSVVQIVSKGGSSEFHGTAFEFFQSDNLNATSWSNNRFVRPGCNTPECKKLRKPEFKRHQFGGAVGGPLWASKRLFFFGSYEGLRELAPSSSGIRTVPTDLQRRGDFSRTYNPDGTLAVIYNPFTTRPDPNRPGQFIRDPFDPSCVGVRFPDPCPGNRIPTSLIDPVASRVIGLFPESTSPGDPITSANNFFKTGTGRVTNDKIEGRIDWVQSEKYRLFGRWSQRARQRSSPPCFYCNGADVEISDNNPGWHLTLNNTITPSSKWVVSVMVGASRWIEEQISASLGKLTPSSIGLRDADFHAPLLPGFTFGGYARFGSSFGQKIRKFPRYTHSLQTDVTYEMSAHSLKFGFWGEMDLINNIDRFSGSFGFGRGLTSGPTAATDSSTTGDSIASLLLGTAASGSTQFNADIAGSMRYYAGYFQDTWRVNPRLTLMFGVRYDIQPGATERFNRLSYFNPDVDNPLGPHVGLPLKGGLQYASSENRRAWKTDKSDWAPRFGFAYKISDKLVMRGGFGIFYVPASSLITFDQPGQHFGFSTNTTMLASVGGGGLIPFSLLRNPYPQGLTPPTGRSRGLETGLGEFIGQTWPTGDHPTGYKQNFSFGFQYEIQSRMVVEVGYTGFRARKLVYGNPNFNPNQLPPSFLSLGQQLDELVPNPFFGQITSGVLSRPTIPRHRLLRAHPQFDGLTWTRSLPGARANYDALSVKFTRQFAGGLMLLSQYQWSKNLDDASEDQGWAVPSQWRDYYNRRMEYSVSSHDVPHSFVTSFVYDLPIGRGRRYGSGMPAVAQQILGNWQVAAIVRLQSGFPVPVNAPNSNSAYGFPRQNPNLVDRNRLELSRRTPERWFNTCTQLANGARTGCASPDEPVAWVQAAPFTIGNGPRYLSNVRSDFIRNTDLVVSKYVRLSESYRLQFRAEFFNAWNTPVFGSPRSFLTGADFGQNFGTRNAPRNIQLALKLDF